MPAAPLAPLFLSCSGDEVAQPCQHVSSRFSLTLPSFDQGTLCRGYAEWAGRVGHSDVLLPRLTDYRPASPQDEQQAFATRHHPTPGPGAESGVCRSARPDRLAARCRRPVPVR
jgi:hypothetical protein